MIQNAAEETLLGDQSTYVHQESLDDQILRYWVSNIDKEVEISDQPRLTLDLFGEFGAPGAIEARMAASKLIWLPPGRRVHPRPGSRRWCPPGRSRWLP